MKKLLTLILAVLFISSLAACGEDDSTSSNASSEGLMSKIENGVSSFMDGVESDISSMTSMLTQSGTSITKEDALDIALKDAGVTKDSIRDYESELDYELGIMVYDIEFKSGDTEYSYEIHAQNGEIIDKDTEKDND